MKRLQAIQLYETRRKRIAGQLDELNKRLSLHNIEARKHPGNYGYAGDLARVEELLKEVNQPLPSR